MSVLGECAWCGQPATKSVVYAEVPFRKKAPACRPCADRIEHHQANPVEIDVKATLYDASSGGRTG